MVTSQNGYEAGNESLLTSIHLPGGSLRVRHGGVATVLQYVAEEFHKRVEPLVWPGCWGYNYRIIPGSTVMSNHGSGTAIDLNAPRHPWHAKGTFTVKQVNTIHQIVRECNGAVRWGGDYVNSTDEMHFEINQDEAHVNAVANVITQWKGIKDMNLSDPLPGNVKDTDGTPVTVGEALARGNYAYYFAIGKLDEFAKANPK